MRSRYLLVAPIVAAIAIGSSWSAPDAAPTHSPGQDMTTLDDQVELSVTVYNSDIALVRDVRRLVLPSGEFDLKFMDIAATVNPATVHFRSLTEPSRVSVLEQNYEYDLLEPDKLLRKYVGREVTLVRTVQQDGSTRQEEVKAELLSYNNAPVWRIGKEIVTGHARRSHPVPRAARQSLQPPDAHLDAAERRRAGASRRGVVPGRQARLERRLRADRRAR